MMTLYWILTLTIAEPGRVTETELGKYPSQIECTKALEQWERQIVPPPGYPRIFFNCVDRKW